MPDQFTVPQFIDAEDQIFGPVTARQFVILMIAGLIDAILFKLVSSLVMFLLIGIPIISFAGIVAFVKINGQPFHFFILNIIQTFRKPKLRVWDKTMNNTELKAFIKEELPEPPPVFHRKEHLGTSRLQELTLVVNTGGVYKPDID